MAILTRSPSIPSLAPFMLVSTLLLSPALAATVVRPSPPAPIANGTSVTWDETPKGQNTCSSSTFSRDPDVPFANWRDCVALYSSWVSQKGVFQIVHTSGDAVVPILQYGGCALGVKASMGFHGSYTVGDLDIGAVLDIALKNYSDGSLLAAKGEFDCDAQAGVRAALHWQIFNPDV